MKQRTDRGFTIVELIASTAAFTTLGLALFSFIWTSTRLVARNLATNHGHSSVLVAEQRLIADLHAAGSAIRLVNFNGTTYSDVTATKSSDIDSFAHTPVSVRANAVRLWKVAGGPYKLTANTTPSSTSLTFDFSSGGTVPYVPQINDKVWLPLIAAEFQITAVTVTPTPGNPIGKITINAPQGVGYTLDTSGTQITTAYFFRQAAYSVFNGELRYHANFSPASQANYIVVQDSITSAKPFAVLFDSTSSTQADGLELRVSLELYDSQYTSRQFLNGTTTIQSVIPIRNQPAFVSLSQSP